MRSNQTRKLCLNAMLAAMCAVLGFMKLDFGNIALTFESLPILIGALMFGPVDGFVIGGVGTLVYQLLRYGVSVTTLLWMLPYMLVGLLAGFYAARNRFELTTTQSTMIICFSEFLVTVLNTGVMYVDSVIYGYYSYAYIFGSLPARLVVFAARAVAFSIAVPVILRALKGLKMSF